MIKTLKKYLIPHKGNDHRPHLLRPRVVAFVMVVALVVEVAFLFSASSLIPRSKLFGIIAVNALIDGTNAARAADGLSGLRENPLLDAAAQQKADDMAANGYFAHTSPTGLTPWYWFEKVGYGFSAAGENLAVNFSDSADVTSAWLNSPEHRANILNAGYTDIGMAAAQGEFEGQPAVYVVELFGMPAVPPAALAAAAPTTMPAAAPAVKTQKPAVQAPMAVATTSESSFVAIKGAASQTSSQAAPGAVAPQTVSVSAPTPQTQSANLIQKAFADPRHTIAYFYLAIILVFAAALLVNVFVKIRIQHPQVILGGMLVVLIAGLFIVLNQHFGVGGIVIL
jgi:hypothetical protein